MSDAGRSVSRMEMRPFGPSNRDVPVVGQGTWYLDRADRKAAIDTLRTGIDLGMTHIDTAEMYGDGAAEEIVGAAIQGRRDEIFLVTKVLPHNASLEGTLAACGRSLERLRTDHIDCYLLHWRGPYPLEDTFTAFERLRAAGRILSWGVSNFDESDLEEARQAAGEGLVTCDQVLYHLKQRAIEHAVIPWCERHHAATVAYSPFGQSDFPGPDSPGGRVLSAIAREHNATPRQVALRFLLRWRNAFVIPKASTPEHAEENAGTGSLHLSKEEIARIDAAFPRGRKPRQLPVL